MKLKFKFASFSRRVSNGLEGTLLDDRLSFANMYPAAQETAPVESIKEYRYVDDGDEPFDWSGVIIVIVVLLPVLVYFLSQSEFFQDWTGTDGWTFLKNKMGWR